MDAISKTRLAQVHPKLSAMIYTLDDTLFAQGIIIRVVQGLRSAADQDALYAQGRTAPGPIVTNAPAGYSAHNFGYAVDLIPGLRNSPQWEPDWDSNSADFRAMIAAGVQLGLVSGAQWVSIKDYPHFQLAGLPITPNATMRGVLLTYGLQTFWDKFIPMGVS